MQTGTRQVRSGTAVRRNGVNGDGTEGIYRDGVGIFPEGSTDQSYAGADGLETVPAWTCQPGCPVQLLDTQGSSSGLGRVDWVRSERQFKGWEKHGDLEQREKPARADEPSGVSRFFPQFAHDPEYDAPFRYVAKASTRERNAGLPEGTRNPHPTVKPVALMRWLVRLVTPPGGTVLDMFAGSGTTGVAAVLEGLDVVLVEREAEYLPIIHARLTHAAGPVEGVAPLVAVPGPVEQPTLFAS